MINSEYIQEAFTKISHQKKEKILDSALKEFAEYGYESANINVIAENAEISVGALYKYFGNKENLYLTTVQVCVQKLKEVIDEITKDNGDITQIIKKTITATQIYTRTNEYLTKFYNQMTTELHSDLVWKIVTDMEGVADKLYTPFIEKAKSEGKIKEEVDPKMFAFFLDNLFMSLQFSYSCEYYKERFKKYAGDDILERDEFIADQLLLFINGALFQ